MSQILRIFSAFIFITAFSISGASAQKVDPALFGALPMVQQAEISPNGETIATLQTINGESMVVFYELTDPEATPKGVGVGAVKPRSIEWVDDEYLMLNASVTIEARISTGVEKLEMFRWIAIAKSDRKLKLLFKQDAGFYVSSAGSILASTPSEPGSAIFARWTPDARAQTMARSSRLQKRDIGDGYSLFKVDLKSGKEKLTLAGNQETIDWIVNANGDALLRVDFDDRKHQRKIFKRRQGSKTFELIKTIQEVKGGHSITFWGVKDASNEVYATTYGNKNTRTLVAYDTNEALVTKTIFENEHYDLDEVIYEPTVATLTGIRYTDDLPRTSYFDPALQKLQDNLAGALPGAAPMIVSQSADATKMIIRAIYKDRPDELYIFDKPTRNLSFFTSTIPSLSQKVYAEKTKYDYTSSGNLAINGYLTTPVNFDKQNMPLIVLPHGGPEGRDDQSFDWWAFFYASRGYAVYQPNFRGSYGYGLKFREAGYGEWGRKMQDDITNGVQKMIADGLVDPSRICIVGASYGGYAALAGAALTPDLYACAVSVNGVSDLPALIGDSGQRSSVGVEYWERRIGSRFKDTAELNAISPAKNAIKVRAPIMLIHGKDDTVVPFYQSQIMSEALTAAGKPHEFIELAGENHWLSSGDTRTEMLRRSIEFIDQHIGQ